MSTSHDTKIALHSGRLFDLVRPQDHAFDIEDIAHALSNQCRFAGQCRQFYSVAEHSILVSQMLSSYQFEGLMHDASEAYIGDVTRPLKHLMPDYREIEEDIERAIAAAFDLHPNSTSLVKKADMSVMLAEYMQLFPGAPLNLKIPVEPAPIEVLGYGPMKAKRLFLNRFRALHPGHMKLRSIPNDL